KTPTFEFDRDQSLASRAAIEAFIKKTGAQLLIEHDLAHFNQLNKAHVTTNSLRLNLRATRLSLASQSNIWSGDGCILAPRAGGSFSWEPKPSYLLLDRWS